MVATSDEEMGSLVSSFDQIYEDFKSGIEERQMLKMKFESEIKRREALQLTCTNLKLENERLSKLYTESLSNMADQLDHRTMSRSLREELNRVKSECLVKEDEYRNAIESLNNDHEKKIGEKEAQISGLLLQQATNEVTVNRLLQDLSANKTNAQTLAMKLECVKSEIESKRESKSLAGYCYVLIILLYAPLYYRGSNSPVTVQLEIQDLRDCLLTEQEEKNELNKKIQDAEKELLIIRTKLLEQQRNLTSSQHIETLKSKIMTLRKENEALKRKLSGSQEG